VDERATGLILRTRPLTETSLIVQWLTPEQGRVATVAKGARRPKSPFRGKLDLFYLAEFSFARSRRSELHTLREVSLHDTHPTLRQDWHKLQQAAYGAALIEQVTETETPLPNIFAGMCALLDYLRDQPAEPKALIAFEVRLLEELGLPPGAAPEKLTAGARQILEHLRTCPWPDVARLHPSPAQVSELRRFLQGFMAYHLERLPPQRGPAYADGVGY
jgi:DNA repair protein RecO (recombination protein O)